MDIYLRKIEEELLKLKKLGYTAEMAKKKIKDRFLKVKDENQTLNFKRVRELVIEKF